MGEITLALHLGDGLDGDLEQAIESGLAAIGSGSLGGNFARDALGRGEGGGDESNEDGSLHVAGEDG